jgi:hypothetical protein
MPLNPAKDVVWNSQCHLVASPALCIKSSIHHCCWTLGSTTLHTTTIYGCAMHVCCRNCLYVQAEAKRVIQRFKIKVDLLEVRFPL